MKKLLLVAILALLGVCSTAAYSYATSLSSEAFINNIQPGWKYDSFQSELGEPIEKSPNYDYNKGISLDNYVVWKIPGGEMLKVQFSSLGDMQSVYVDGNIIRDYSPKNGEKEISEVLVRGDDPDKLQLLLDLGIDVNVQNEGFDTPLIYAIRYRRYKSVDVLLNNSKINVNAKGEKGRTALMVALDQGDDKTANRILSFNDVNVNARDINGNSALFYAARCKHYSVVNQLIKKGAHINQTNNDGMTPLMNAVDQISYKVVEDILSQNGVNVNMQDSYGDSALTIALKYQNIGVFRLLMKSKDVNVNLPDKNGKTVLSKYAEKDNKGSKEIMRSLLAKGADPNYQDKNGVTPLMDLVGDYKNISTILSDKRTNLNIQDNDGNTALIYAIIAHGIETENGVAKSKLLVEVPEIKDKLGIFFMNPEDENLIFNRFAEIIINENITDASQKEKLNQALKQSRNTSSHLLRLFRNNTNMLSQMQTDPYLSVATNERAMLELINKGANVNLANKSGITPLMAWLISNKENISIVNAFIRAGVRVNDADSYGNTALNYATARGFELTTKLLLK